MQRFELPFGAAHVFYPEASEARCAATLLLDVDPIALVRRGRAPAAFALADYVNDRPYVASSLLSVALLRVWRWIRSSWTPGSRSGAPAGTLG